MSLATRAMKIAVSGGSSQRLRDRRLYIESPCQVRLSEGLTGFFRPYEENRKNISRKMIPLFSA